MKFLLCLVTVLFSFQFINAQWVRQTVNTTASFRGLSVVNEKVIWASGTEGTVIRTIDGGKTWKVMTVPGAEKLDFRDIEAFDANTAYILSIGNGESSRIYKTIDGGKTWKEQFRNKSEKAFFDAIDCSSREHCYALSDPVENHFLLTETRDGGEYWDSTFASEFTMVSPKARSDEAAFAASGTCLTHNFLYRFFVTGGSGARVFRAFWSPNTGASDWEAFSTPFVHGSSGSGIFSIAMFDIQNGVIVGGDYEKPNEAIDNLAFTHNSGETWKLGTGLSGYRSAVTYVDKKTIIAVGTNGTDMTRDGGKTWKKIGDENLNAVAANGKRAVWAVGPKGMVVKMKK
ncbi:MAG: glycosyl hydrolase [Chloracidobacterium sp.]|nr:glycosyl hydrolase [Chloracidobacterium sp.]